jgi:hypothetical protein
MSTNSDQPRADRTAAKHTTSTRHPIQTVAMVYGIVFLLVGPAPRTPRGGAARCYLYPLTTPDYPACERKNR